MANRSPTCCTKAICSSANAVPSNPGFAIEAHGEARLGHMGLGLPDRVRAEVEDRGGEHGARMAAMDAASRNAGEMIDRLTLYMNKVRQAAITKEIIEVVSGAGAPS